MPKYIFVTGGVVSSIGKGVTAAAIAKLLQSRGFKVFVQKLDPYLNVDPGTLSPYQHGEVFVTDDGAETDLDLGHYERFSGACLTKESNVTAGQIYLSVIEREREGKAYLGRTIQTIPHVTDEIKQRIRKPVIDRGLDGTIVEIGGTVGDIEGQPFLEAIRQMRLEEGWQNTLCVHITLVPVISTTGEFKTKPTQHSVKELRSFGIRPDVIILRCEAAIDDESITAEIREKVSLYCEVDPKAIILLPTVRSIYQVPLIVEEKGLGTVIADRLELPRVDPDLNDWREFVTRSERVKKKVSIGIVGKYVGLRDAYLSVREALFHAAVWHNARLEIRWIESEDLEQEGWEELLEGLEGIIVPGGFGSRGIEGKIRAARFARQSSIPYLGLCLGMQIMVIEYARHVLNSTDVHSTEFDPQTEHPVIDLLEDQRVITEKGGTMRLGVYPCHLADATLAANAYNQQVVEERHRHRFEFNNKYREILTQHGLIISGTSPTGELVEICEIADHPWMLGTQFHPEFKSHPTHPHPLFKNFVGTVIAKK